MKLKSRIENLWYWHQGKIILLVLLALAGALIWWDASRNIEHYEACLDFGFADKHTPWSVTYCTRQVNGTTEVRRLDDLRAEYCADQPGVSLELHGPPTPEVQRRCL